VISLLIDSLIEGDVALEPQEIADCLWLARARGGTTLALEGLSARSISTLPSEPPPPDVEAHDPPALSDRDATSEGFQPTDVAPRSRPDAVVSAAMSTSLTIPTALPGRLELGRALRPFNQRHPSRRNVILDEEATVDFYCETGVLNPVLRLGDERWFDVDLVVDAGPSMVVWRDTAAELAHLLERHGAFRFTRRWRLEEAEHEVGLVSDSGMHYEPLQFVDPDARRLVIIFTDCIGSMWYRPSVWSAIEQWGRFTPVAILNVLPARLWSRTALGTADVTCRSHRPGVPNSSLDVRLPWWWPDDDRPTQALPVPVITLEGHPMTQWAQVVMGSGEAATRGVLAVAPRHEDAGDDAGTPAPLLSVEDRVRQFRATVSLTAYRLAVYMAAALRGRWPVHLARVVQQVMLPESRQTHLAEVLVGGLVRLENEAGPEPVFAFLEGVEPVLRQSLTGSESLLLVGALDQYIEDATGEGAGFSTMLLRGDVSLSIPEPFDDLSAAAIDLIQAFRLGGAETSTPVRRDNLDIPESPAQLRVFCSYAHEDHRFADELKQHLRVLIQREEIEWWDDRVIKPGDDWTQLIHDNLLRADVIILLLSAHFFDSEYVVHEEFETALTRRNEGALLIPLLIESYPLSGTPFSTIQVLPTRREGELRPVVNWRHRDQAYRQVLEAIQRYAESRESGEILSLRTTEISAPIRRDLGPSLPKADRGPDESPGYERSPVHFTVDMLPAESGTSLLIEYGTMDSTQRVLVDCGPSAKPILHRIQGHLELLVLTHIDTNSIAGALELLQDPNVDIDDTWFNGYRHLTSESELS
jgi:TIR domain